MLIRPNEQVVPVRGRLGLYRRYLRQSLAPETVADFEREARQAFSVAHAVATLSGTMALTLILEALQLPRGAGVILPAYTYFGLPGVLERAGLVPIFADVEPVAARLQVDRLAAAELARARAVLVPQLFGVLTDTSAIRRALGDHVVVIADCAHASLVGVGPTVASQAFGDVAFVSFDRVKLLDTMRGGMILLPDGPRAEKIKSALPALPPQPVARTLRTMLLYEVEAMIRHPYCYSLLGRLLARPQTMDWIRRQYRRLNVRAKQGDYRLSPLQAAIGLTRLREAPARNARRVSRVRLILDQLAAKATGTRERQYLGEVERAFVTAAPYPSSLVINVRSPEVARRFAQRLGFELLIGSRMAEFFGGAEPYRFPGAAHLFAHAAKLPILENVNEDRYRRFVEKFTAWLANELAPFPT